MLLTNNEKYLFVCFCFFFLRLLFLSWFAGCVPGLDEVSHVHGHLVNLSVIEHFNVLEHTFIFTCDEVDGYTFSAKPASTANPEVVEEIYMTTCSTHVIVWSQELCTMPSTHHYDQGRKRKF